MQDRYGLLPPVIAHNYAREEMADRLAPKLESIFRALQALDPRLDLVLISPRADPEYGVVPGRWHVVRYNDRPAPDTYIPITTEDGGYREPDSSVVSELQNRDLWKHGIPKHEQPKSDTLRKEQEVDEIVSDVKAALRVSDEGGMTKRKWGRG